MVVASPPRGGARIFLPFFFTTRQDTHPDHRRTHTHTHTQTHTHAASTVSEPCSLTPHTICTRLTVHPTITRHGGSRRGARCGVNVSRSPRAARRPARWRGGAGSQSPPAAARGEARSSMLGGRARASEGERGRKKNGVVRGKRGSRAERGRARLQQVLCSRCAEALRVLRV